MLFIRHNASNQAIAVIDWQSNNFSEMNHSKKQLIPEIPFLRFKYGRIYEG